MEYIPQTQRNTEKYRAADLERVIFGEAGDPDTYIEVYHSNDYLTVRAVPHFLTVIPRAANVIEVHNG